MEQHSACVAFVWLCLYPHACGLQATAGCEQADEAVMLLVLLVLLVQLVYVAFEVVLCSTACIWHSTVHMPGLWRA